MTAPPVVPVDTAANPELTIAAVAVVISLIGLILSVIAALVPWLRDGKASLSIHYEMYRRPTPTKDRIEDERLVIRNAGPGDAYNVTVRVLGAGENLNVLLYGSLSYERIPPGHTVHIPLVTDFDHPVLDTASVAYSHGRFAADPIALRNRPVWLRWIRRDSRSSFDAPLTAHHVA